MRNKIINFFHAHRIIDSHFGLWEFHAWVYLLATYLDLHLIGVSIRIFRWQILSLYVNFNLHAKPHSLSFKFEIFGVGIDTDRKYNEKVHQNYEEHSNKQRLALKEFKDSLDDKQEELIKQYDYLK